MRRKVDFFMHTTAIAPEKTAAEIQQLLGRKGANQILLEYCGGEIIGLAFILKIQGRNVPFKLPVRWDKCLIAMKRLGVPRHFCNEEQARRTAWRNALRWLESQFAFSDTEQVDVAEVLLPYVYTGKETLYEKLAHDGFKMIPEKT